MMKYISNMRHRMGSHCSSTLMSDILRKYGIELSEDLCFGIGSGLGFLYRKCWSPSYYMVLGRGHDIEEKIGQHLGLFTEINISYDNTLAWREVKRLLDQDRPVLVDVDAKMLPYMREKFELFDFVRYGGHKACIVGYDDENGQAALYDYAWPKEQLVSYEELAAARGSDVGEFPSSNMWICVYLPEKLPRGPESAIIKGIGYNIHTMKYPVTAQTGLTGLEKFLRQAPYWPLEGPEERVRKNAYIAYMMLETVGTGGGNFRRIYARFLKEAAGILGMYELGHVSELYFNLSHNWMEIGRLLKKSSENIHEGIFREDRVAGLLDETAGMERSGIEELQRIMERNAPQEYLFIDSPG